MQELRTIQLTVARFVRHLGVETGIGFDDRAEAAKHAACVNQSWCDSFCHARKDLDEDLIWKGLNRTFPSEWETSFGSRLPRWWVLAISCLSAADFLPWMLFAWTLALRLRSRQWVFLRL